MSYLLMGKPMFKHQISHFRKNQATSTLNDISLALSANHKIPAGKNSAIKTHTTWLSLSMVINTFDTCKTSPGRLAGSIPGNEDSSTVVETIEASAVIILAIRSYYLALLKADVPKITQSTCLCHVDVDLLHRNVRMTSQR